MLGLLKKKKKQRAVVIGIDGLPYTLIKQYVEQGVMPQFGRMISEGTLHQMKSSLPEVSSVAWTSFMTGKNPGEHGILGFMEIDDRYQYRFPNYRDVKVQTFWERLNVPSAILNLPQTYPATRPLNGILVSGFVALDLQKAAYPEATYQYLKNIGYRLDVNANLAATNPSAFFEDLMITFEKRLEAFRYFWQNQDWQIFVATVTETDRLHHFFYPQTTDDGEYHNRIIEFYRKLDAFIGEMYAAAKEKEALFMTCSDHGFTPIKTEVYINRWLMENGYLELADKEKGLPTISEQSRAFCLDPSRIYIHRKGVYPKGPVSDGEYPKLRDELVARLQALNFDGQPVVKQGYFGEEIFRGPESQKGPDICLLSNYGFDLKGALKKPNVFGTSHFKGMHTYNDAHFFISRNEQRNDVCIQDLAGIIEAHVTGK